MAVRFETIAAAQLLAKFKIAVAAQHGAKGSITTWIKSSEGDYYTHAAADWKHKAWFKPSTKSDGLVFNILPAQGQTVSALAYAYYHGHLIETFLNHFDQDFSWANASALPKTPDRVS